MAKQSNTYLCKGCGRQATKPACKKGEVAGLGHWSCSRCGKTKVDVKKN